MDTINRSALVVKPAQPFLDWLHRVDPTSIHLTLEDLRGCPRRVKLFVFGAKVWSVP